MGANDVEQILVRIYLGESRSAGGEPLHRQLLELFSGEGLPGATVVKGCTGYGHDRVVHTTRLECQTVDLPVVIETVDSPEHVDQLLAKIDAVMTGGLVVTERARVVRFRP